MCTCTVHINILSECASSTFQNIILKLYQHVHAHDKQMDDVIATCTLYVHPKISMQQFSGMISIACT